LKDTLEFVTEDEWKKVQAADGRQIVNEILSRLYFKAIESTLRSLPELISRLTEQTATLNALTVKFFEANPEFKNYKELVSATVSEIEEQNPGLSYSDILAKSAISIKTKIEVIKSANQSSFNFGGN